MKVLKIIGCSDSLMWYRNRIGDTVDFIGEDSQYYWSRDNGGYKNIVKKCDGLIMDVQLNLTREELKILADLIRNVDCKDMVRTTYDRDVELAIKQRLIDKLSEVV